MRQKWESGKITSKFYRKGSSRKALASIGDHIRRGLREMGIIVKSMLLNIMFLHRWEDFS